MKQKMIKIGILESYTPITVQDDGRFSKSRKIALSSSRKIPMNRPEKPIPCYFYPGEELKKSTFKVEEPKNLFQDVKEVEHLLHFKKPIIKHIKKLEPEKLNNFQDSISTSGFVPYKDYLQSLVSRSKESETRKRRQTVKKTLEEQQLMHEITQKYKSATMEEHKAALTLQAIYKGKIQRKAYQKLLKKRETRKRNSLELLSTEVTYVTSLRVAVEVYLNPLRKHATEDPKPLVTLNDIRAIFSHIEVIQKVNEVFLKRLQESLSNYSHHVIISELFDGIVHFFKTYTDYCNNFDRANSLLSSLKKKYPQFKAMISGMDSNSKTNGLGLQSYLILPIQRIPRYRLIIQDIIKNTEEWHPDYENLKKSRDQIMQVADHLNTAMKNIERSRDMFKLSSQLYRVPDDFKLQEGHRHLVKIGKCELEDRENQFKGVDLYLCNDVLVLTKPGKFSYVDRCMLNQCKLYGNQSNERKFRIKYSNKKFDFLCPDEETAQDWLKNISDCMEIVQKKDRIKINTNKSKTSKKTLKEALTEDYDILTPEECVKEMKKGAAMLKYCRKGRPHFRHFALSSDESEIRWGSPKKKKADSKVLVSSIKKIFFGQDTELFKKYPNPRLSNVSFSLLYNQKRTLDMIASSKREYHIWITGLQYMLSDEYAESRKSQRNQTQEAESVEQKNNSLKGEFKAKFKEIGDGYSWGQSYRGSLGQELSCDQHIPSVVKNFLYLDVQEMFCGEDVGFGVMTSGAIFSWGSGKYGKTAHGDQKDHIEPTRVNFFRGKAVVQVGIGTMHTLFRMADHSCWSVGEGIYGQLGLGDTKSTLVPKKILGMDELKIVHVSTGYMHCACVTQTGGIYTWGRGEDYQLGHGNTNDFSVPTAVEVLKKFTVVKSALGMWHTMALTDQGKLWTWGDSTFGQCGHGKLTHHATPELLDSKQRFIDIAAGGSHSVAVDAEGIIWIWGNGLYGQLGNGSNENSAIPIKVDALQQFRTLQIVCGSNHVLAHVTINKTSEENADSQVYAWGSGVYGRLGTNSEKNQLVPRRIDFLKEKVVRKVAAGGCLSACVCAHQWIPDFDVKACMSCNRDFTFMRRRHHCRYCGGLFCNNCSSKRIALLRFGFSKPVRVCDLCYNAFTEI